MGAICPGQDTRYWKPDDIFEIDCGQCGTSIEFFKDDVRRRCYKCGTIVQNPKITLGCAQWCEHAKECLGYDPKETAEEDAEAVTLLDKMIEAVKGRFSKDQARLAHALSVTEEAEDLLRGKLTEKANRKIVLASALLHDFEDQQETEKILKDVGMDKPSIQDVTLIVESSNGSSVESRIVADAHQLAELRANIRTGGGCLDQPPDLTLYQTEAGRARAAVILQSPEQG